MIGKTNSFILIPLLLSAVAAIIFTCFKSSGEQKKGVSMTQKKNILFILMPKGFQPLEFATPYAMLQKAGHQVNIAGFNAGVAVAANGQEQKVDYVLDALTNQDFDTYDAVVIPGGPGSTEYLWGNEKVQKVVQYFHKQNKIVATICYACIVPAEAGLLTGKTATVFPTEESKEIFDDHDVLFSTKTCVVDVQEKMITAQGPAYAAEFGQEILNLLGS